MFGEVVSVGRCVIIFLFVQRISIIHNFFCPSLFCICGVSWILFRSFQERASFGGEVSYSD